MNPTPAAWVCQVNNGPILDGDQAALLETHIKAFVNRVGGDKVRAAAWVRERLGFLPGDSSPEIFVFSALRNADKDLLAKAFKFERGDDLIELFDSALLSGDHNELNEVAAQLHLDPDEAWRRCSTLLAVEYAELLRSVDIFIKKRLAVGE